nr:hypothetical protein [Endozoicomonas sp.]
MVFIKQQEKGLFRTVPGGSDFNAFCKLFEKKLLTKRKGGMGYLFSIIPGFWPVMLNNSFVISID